MRIMKKSIVFLLLISLIASMLCSCDNDNIISPEETTSPSGFTQTEGVLNLAYTKSDTLNPYTTSTTANLQILSLVYDGLYKLDKAYEPVPVIAKSSIVSGTTVNVTLNNVSFSDGTPVTAGDVVKSFDKAKFSTAFSARLENFIGANMSTSNMVVFTLKNPDPYALSCLTFPIIKGSSSAETPVGSGRYKIEKSGESVYLVVNSKKSSFNPSIKTIMLVPVRAADSLESSVEIGNTAFHYNDLADGTYSRINAKTVEMGINNLIYLAFNSSSEIFADARIRQAVNLAINRTEIATTAFQGHARATYTPFNPEWYALASKDLMLITQNVEKASQLIAESGVDVTSKEVSVLVNSDNQFKLETAQFICDYLKLLGFKVILKDYSVDYYKEAINLGSYDLYIGEVKLPHNMDLSAILTPDGSIGYGINFESPTAKRYAQLISGNCELMDFINTFNEDPPFLPLCFRNAAVSYATSLQNCYGCCDGDVFYDIENWSFK